MLSALGLAVLACALGLLTPPPEGIHGKRTEQALDLVRITATAGLAVTLLLGPGIFLRASSDRWRKVRLAFLPLPGAALLFITGGLAWALAGTIEPRIVSIAVFAPLLGLLFGGLLRTGPDDMFDSEEQRVLLIVGCALGLAIARTVWSLGAEGELFAGTIARTLEVGDRSDSRLSFGVVQLVAHGTAPFSEVGGQYFAPYNFSSRGPLPGLGSAPLVFLAGGKPPIQLPENYLWQPFDQQGFMAYRIAMMTMASTAFLALWDLVRRLGGWRAARFAVLLAVTTPFLVHEVWFTWPKLFAAYFVVLAGICIVERRALRSGLLVGLAYLVHPGALLSLAAVGLLALWPLKGANWRQPQLRAAVLMVAGVAVCLIAWRLVNGDDYTQSGFLEYFSWAGSDYDAAPLDWLAYRAASVGNTFVPMMLMLFGNTVSINTFGGQSPPVIHFFFQYWNGLPFGFGIVFFPLLAISVWRAWQLWRWPVFATIVAPLVFFAIYWGASKTGMMREGLHVWALTLVALVALQQRQAGFPWLRSKPIRAVLALRSAELLLVAIGPALATTNVIISPVYRVTDIASVIAMIAFSIVLASLVWSTTPEALEQSGPPEGAGRQDGG